MTNQRHSRGLRTRDVNEVFARRFADSEGELRSNHPWLVRQLDEMCSGRPITPQHTAPPRLDLRSRAILFDAASHVGVYRLWARRGRVTYDLNEHMAAELYRSSIDELPGDVFSRLPHINPLVVLPDPWPLSFGTGSALVRGFYVFGFNQNPEQQTYTDEDIEGLGLLFVVDTLDPETGEVAYETCVRMNIPTGLERFTVAHAVDFAAARSDSVWAQAADEDAVYALFEEMLRPTLAILIYLCCDNRDLAEVPVVAPARRKRKRIERQRDPFFVEVGWRMGPALHAARRAAGRVRSGDGFPSGVQQAPHQRSGHFRRFRVGKGRKMTTTRFVMPYWVRLDLLAYGEDPITTVVPVDPQRRDPLRRRGMQTGGRGSRAQVGAE